MSKKTLLIPVDKRVGIEALKPWVLAASSNGFHLSILIIGVAPALPGTAFNMVAYSGIEIVDEWRKNVQADAKELEAKVNEVTAMINSAKVSAEVRSAHCEQSFIDDEVASSAAVSDLSALPLGHGFDPSIKDIVISALLFTSPIGVIIHAYDPAAALSPKSALVAWNAELPSARAIHAALPQLKKAEKVNLVSFDSILHDSPYSEVPGAKVVSWLSRLGCKASLQHLPTNGREIAVCIEDQAIAYETDLVVMGAYGHSKLKQRMFGGTTSKTLEKAPCAVLMAH